MSVELHIEELVLHGFAPGDRYKIGEAVQLELQRLLAEQSVPHPLNAGVELAQIDAGAFYVQPNAKPGATGAQVAQAVYGGIRR
jgi:hypothetical protein